MTEAELRYFAQAGPTTDLADHSDLLAELPPDPRELARIVRGLVIHEGVAAHCGLQFPPERRLEREITGAAAVLECVLRLDDSPLRVERKPESRMLGYCYHFAVLHCALLRAKGVPSRARCGFAAYYRDDAWIDHWVVEYWDAGRWVVIDPDSGRDSVSGSDFHDAGLAWRLCRTGDDDPSRHGNHVLWGWDELRGSLINDVGALNKVEVGGWEGWCHLIAVEQPERPCDEIDSYLDTLAGLVSSDETFEELQRSFDQDERLRPPPALLERTAV